jgi:hypothetical protein
MDAVNPRRAKELVAAELARLGLPPYRLTARTIGFSDLLRTSCVFVAVHGWQPDRRWEELAAFARSHGFRVEAG